MGGYCCSGTGGDVCGGRGCGAEGCGASDASGEVNGRVSSSSSGATSGGTDGSRSIPVSFASCWWAAGRCFESRFSRGRFGCAWRLTSVPLLLPGATRRAGRTIGARRSRRRAPLRAVSCGPVSRGSAGDRCRTSSPQRCDHPRSGSGALPDAASPAVCLERRPRLWWRGDWTRERPRRSCSAIRSWGGGR
jgi:hypothetical protein